MAVLMRGPRSLGLPSKFSEFRPQQLEALEANLSSKERFLAHSMPTGSGKSLVYVAHALATGVRTVVLTSTKGLQDQLMRDFAVAGLVDIRGRENYRCHAFGVSCAEAADLGCADAGTCKCPYTRAYTRAMASRLVVTNYAYWVSINRYGPGLGSFGLMCLDEAHLAPDELAAALAVEISYRDLGRLALGSPKQGSPVGEWIRWARDNAWRFSLQAGQERFLSLSERRLCGAVLALATLADESWVITEREDGFVAEPVNVAPYAEEFLFCGVPKVVFYSALLVPKVLEMLGVRASVYRDYPYVFDPSRSPVYHVPCCRVNRRMGHQETFRWTHVIDSIIEGRTDRKGIVHTVSYSLQRCLLSNSRWKSHMIGHTGSRDLPEAVEKYRFGRSPKVLVSPSVSTGWDFPGDQCRYQIVAKVPWPDLSSPVVVARERLDTEYAAYVAARTLVQATGRGMRSADDWCESFVVDDGIRDFVRRYPRLIPRWWMDLYREVGSVPQTMAIK